MGREKNQNLASIELNDKTGKPDRVGLIKSYLIMQTKISIYNITKMQPLSSSSPLLTTPSSAPNSRPKFSQKTPSKFSPKPPPRHLKTQPPPPTTPRRNWRYKPPSKSKSKSNQFPEEDAFPESLPLHSKNPHSIYKDIQRFAREDKFEQSFTILDYLDKQGIPVNPTTFNSLISACIRTKSLSRARQVHTFIRTNGLENNEFLRTKLVEMYTACGSIEDAEKLFDEIPKRQLGSVYPWNALLKGNVTRGGWRKRGVLETYSKMRELGVELNVYSYACLIKSFAGSPSLGQGAKLHAHLIKSGFADGSIVLQTSLIDFYFKCGKIKLAHQVFEEILERDVVVWGAMIAGFAHNRLRREALEYLRWMIIEGIEPNSVIVTTILPVIGEVSERKLGREVHAFLLKKKSYAEHVFVQSGLIDMYCKCRDMVSGRRVFYSTVKRNVVCWTALISGYALNGRLDQALRSIAWMQQEGLKPDVVTIATVLPVCAELKVLKQGKEIHGYVLKNCYLPNVSIVTSLMVMYSRCGMLEYSSKLFGGMEMKNVISWTAMMDSYLKNHCHIEALAVFRTMQLSKHRPDSVTISRILTACTDSRVLKLGKEIHGYILKRGYESIPFVTAQVLKMYGRCGELEKAKLVFDLCPSRGAITQTAIIEAYGYNHNYQEALKLFHMSIDSGFVPNHFTFEVVLSICERAGFGDECCKLFDTMMRKYNIKPFEEHYSIIIGLLTRLGRTEEAHEYACMRSSMV